jgi:hypothetical protein
VVGAKHLPRYLGAFAWRFNRRFVLKTIHERLAVAGLPPPEISSGSLVGGKSVIKNKPQREGRVAGSISTFFHDPVGATSQKPLDYQE